MEVTFLVDCAQLCTLNTNYRLFCNVDEVFSSLHIVLKKFLFKKYLALTWFNFKTAAGVPHVGWLALGVFIQNCFDGDM